MTSRGGTLLPYLVRTLSRPRACPSGRETRQELERRLPRSNLDALGPAPRAELLHVLMLPDFDRADRIGEFWSYPESRAFAELLIDCAGDRRCGLYSSGCCGKLIARAGRSRSRAARRASDGREAQAH